MKNRFEGHLCLSVSSKRVLKICDVSIARETLISMLMCWPLLCTNIVYKLNESSNIYLEEIEYNPNSTLRRDPSNSTVSKVSGSGKGNSCRIYSFISNCSSSSPISLKASSKATSFGWRGNT